MIQRKRRGAKRRAASASERVDAARVSAIVQKASLTATRIGQIKAHVVDACLEEGATWTPEMSFNAGLRMRGATAAGDNLAVFIVSLRFRSKDIQSAEGEPGALIEVHRLVAYVGIPIDATDAELGAFAQHTVLFNTWPMLRSDVLDLSMKLGLHPVLLPLLRLRPSA